MHVRIAWEIHHHQQKQQADAKAGSVVSTKTDLLRPPGHLYPGGPGSLGLGASSMAPPFLPNMPSTHPAPPPSHPVGFLSTPTSHLGNRGNKDSHLFTCMFVFIDLFVHSFLSCIFLRLIYNYNLVVQTNI